MQAEGQCKQLRQIEDQLIAANEQIGVLKKKLEEVKKAIEKAEQDGYKVGVVETEDTLRAKVFSVCRIYCLQVWNEALNQAGVDASSALRRAKNIYYPPCNLSISPLQAPKLKLLPRRLILARIALPRSSLLLTTLLGRQNKMRYL